MERPGGMYYLGPSVGGAGLIFGALGALAASGREQSEADQFGAFIASHGIDIRSIVLEEARQAFQRSGKMTLLPPGNAGAAKLNIAVTQYGFSIPTSFSSRLVPILRVDASLTDAANNVIWRSSDSTSPLGNPAQARSLEEFRADPKLVEEAWRTAARAAFAGIVSAL